MLAPSGLYLVSQKATYRDWPRRAIWLPALVTIGVGIAASNSRAVFEALAGKQSAFVRTPKRGDREIKRYALKCPWTAGLELCLGIYCMASLWVYLSSGKYLIGPFLAIYAAGFLTVGLLSAAESAKYYPTG